MVSQTRKRILPQVFTRILILLFFFAGIIRPTLAQGSGYTLSFDGISVHISLGNQVANGCRTIEMWFKPASNITSTLNEEFGMVYDCILSNFRIQIYNRWGELIFESYDPAIFWD